MCSHKNPALPVEHPGARAEPGGAAARLPFSSHAGHQRAKLKSFRCAGGPRRRPTPPSKYRSSSVMRSGAVRRWARAHPATSRRKNSILISTAKRRRDADPGRGEDLRNAPGSPIALVGLRPRTMIMIDLWM